LAAPLNQVEMTVGRRVKRAGINGGDLLQWASSDGQAR
jgi:hypothetical protein